MESYLFAAGIQNDGKKNMPTCKKCGAELGQPKKEWDMKPKDGRGPALHVKHYRCDSCKASLRVGEKIPTPVPTP
jgi:hypothetical protein